MSLIPNLIYRFKTNPVKIPESYSVGSNKLIVNLTCQERKKKKRPWIANKILKSNSWRTDTLWFKNLVKATEIRIVVFVVVQSLSLVPDFVTPWTAAARLPCPSLSPGVCSNSCPLSGWYHPTISTKLGEVMPLLFLPSIFHSIRVFFQWVGSLHHVAKLTGASASASVLPMNIQG